MQALSKLCDEILNAITPKSEYCSQCHKTAINPVKIRLGIGCRKTYTVCKKCVNNSRFDRRLSGVVIKL